MGAAALGVPLTHRDECHGVAFVTGHARQGEEPNWRALAQSGMTLVVYMGMARLESIGTALMASGLAARTPVAIVQDATTKRQRHCFTTLGRAGIDARSGSLGSPAIVVIGEVVARAAARAPAADGAKRWIARQAAAYAAGATIKPYPRAD